MVREQQEISKKELDILIKHACYPIAQQLIQKAVTALDTGLEPQTFDGQYYAWVDYLKQIPEEHLDDISTELLKAASPIPARDERETFATLLATLLATPPRSRRKPSIHNHQEAYAAAEAGYNTPKTSRSSSNTPTPKGTVENLKHQLKKKGAEAERLERELVAQQANRAALERELLKSKQENVKLKEEKGLIKLGDTEQMALNQALRHVNEQLPPLWENNFKNGSELLSNLNSAASLFSNAINKLMSDGKVHQQNGVNFLKSRQKNDKNSALVAYQHAYLLLDAALWAAINPKNPASLVCQAALSAADDPGEKEEKKDDEAAQPQAKKTADDIKHDFHLARRNLFFLVGNSVFSLLSNESPSNKLFIVALLLLAIAVGLLITAAYFPNKLPVFLSSLEILGDYKDKMTSALSSIGSIGGTAGGSALTYAKSHGITFFKSNQSKFQTDYKEVQEKFNDLEFQSLEEEMKTKSIVDQIKKALGITPKAR
jgi:hypothetical protein